MSKPIKVVQGMLKRMGLEVVPYPPSDWVLCRNILRKTLHGLEIDCVLDVGANHGQYGSLLRDIGYAGKIISFEPIRAHFEAVKKCAAERGNWTAFNVALGAEDAEREINVMEEDALSSFLSPLNDDRTRKSHPRNKVMRTERVQIRRLDGFANEIPAAKLYLKMDTQGFDLEVLRGAEGILDRVAGLQTEISFRPIYGAMPGYREALSACEGRGFSVVDFMPVVRDADGLKAIEMDCVMARS